MALLEPKTVELADGIFVDVDPDNEMLRLRIGNESRMIRKSELYSFCYIIADSATQDQLTPIKMTEVQHFTRMHRIKLKKDMRAGDTVTCRCHVSVPTTVVEGLKHIVDRKKTIHGGIPIIGGGG